MTAIRPDTRANRHPSPTLSLYLFSYADDVNPVLTTDHMTTSQHQDSIKSLQGIREDEAHKDHLTWDRSKDQLLTFGRNNKDTHGSLGITISGNLDWSHHIRAQVNKAKAALASMLRVGNSSRSIPPSFMRSWYTSKIRQIMLWGAETWYNDTEAPQAFRTLEYKALRKITGAYHGSAHHKLGFIANVEPLELKLSHSLSMAAKRLIQHGDPIFRQLLDQVPPPGTIEWHFGCSKSLTSTRSHGFHPVRRLRHPNLRGQ